MSTDEVVGKIMQVTTVRYHVTIEELTSRRHTAHLAHARQMAAYAMRELTDLSYPIIGRLVARHHATIMYAHRKIRASSANGRANEVATFMQACRDAIAGVDEEKRLVAACLEGLMMQYVPPEMGNLLWAMIEP